MSSLLNRSFVWGLSVATTLFTFVPDAIIGHVKCFDKLSDDCNLFINKVIILLVVFLLSLLVNWLYNHFRTKIKIKGSNYTIQVEFGDLLKCKGCQRVIAFDECFTTKIGTKPHEIKTSSICGQYLRAHPGLNVQKVVAEAGLKPEEAQSKYNNQQRYKSGSIAPNGDDLLMAFAMLDESGRGFFPTIEDFLNSLAHMWTEIHKNYQKKDVCIPVLGGGQTSIGETTPTHQELIDLIIESYKLNLKKIKNPQMLRIICWKGDGVSLNRIGDAI